MLSNHTAPKTFLPHMNTLKKEVYNFVVRGDIASRINDNPKKLFDFVISWLMKIFVI